MDRELAEQLIEKASQARNHARTPLSGFRVGAALLAQTGEIVTGCNTEQQNMYESICAERCAIVKAVSMGLREFAAIAVVSDAKYPLAPCGLCRQALIDYGAHLLVIMSNADRSQVCMMTAGELMPAYDLTNLELCKPLESYFERQ